jgi:hypothetical protein
MKKLIVCLTISMLGFSAYSQILKPVIWSYAAKKTGTQEATVYLKASIENGYHIYLQYVKSGGPLKTSFVFPASKTYILVGKTVEPKAITHYEQTFAMNVSYFEKSVVFRQKVKLRGDQAVVRGTLSFMSCNDTSCQPPEEIAFSIPVSL